MDLFDSILATTNDSDSLQGLQYGIVADVSDPLNLQRLQVYDQAKGGKHKSGWLIRGLPFTNFSPPVPKVGDLVIFGYILGDPHHGCYIGCVVNNNNRPIGADEDFAITLGSASVTIAVATGNVEVRTEGAITAKGKTITLEADTVTIKTATLNLDTVDAKLSGKDLAVIGGRDTHGDTINYKGY